MLAAMLLSSCGEYNKLLKSTDYEYKYEAAKNYFAKGKYSKSATLLNELITILKGTDKAEESLYMLGMSYYNQKDYRLLLRLSLRITTLIREARLLNWHVSMPEKVCVWIPLKPVLISRELTRLFRSCRCFWSISPIAPRSRKHRI